MREDPREELALPDDEPRQPVAFAGVLGKPDSPARTLHGSDEAADAFDRNQLVLFAVEEPRRNGRQALRSARFAAGGDHDGSGEQLRSSRDEIEQPVTAERLSYDVDSFPVDAIASPHVIENRERGLHVVPGARLGSENERRELLLGPDENLDEHPVAVAKVAFVVAPSARAAVEKEHERIGPLTAIPVGDEEAIRSAIQRAA